MKVGGPRGRLGWIAILAIALLMTALQAKLGLYRPVKSQAQLISKSFKLSEGRLNHAVPSPPVTAIENAVAESPDDWRPEPDFLEYVSTPPRPPLLSRSHWSRPPPARS